MSGVYFLVKDGIVVYVGQSTNVEKRLINHKHSEKQFDSFRVISCAENLLLYYERRWIKRFKPIYNMPTGGSRIGAGRPKGANTEPSIVMRIPVSLVAAVKEIIKK
jgi:hypothetical protein